MAYGAAQVLTTVNAPYGAKVSAHQLAAMITDFETADSFSAPVFAFFSEVSAPLQAQFIDAMGVDKNKARKVAAKLSALCGYTLSLAA